VKLELLGVRGSTAAPGADFVRYGGHTSCVAVVPEGAVDPTLILDAGTGIRSLTPRLSTPAFRGSILLSHLHWDHVQGLPFFVAGDQPASVVDVYLPAQQGESGGELLARAMSPPSFPIEPTGLHGTWTFTAVEPGPLAVPGFEVTCAELAHKGGRTFGYRVADARGAMAYLPDHGPVQGCSEEAQALVRGVDVLLHDGQFVAAERAVADDYGHATVDEAIDLAVRGGVGTLVLLHHSPARTDDQLDALAASIRAPIPVIVAHEGQILDVPVRAVAGQGAVGSGSASTTAGARRSRR
jgi:ribonuclease BN (tRNA processing enzyme)